MGNVARKQNVRPGTLGRHPQHGEALHERRHVVHVRHALGKCRPSVIDRVDATNVAARLAQHLRPLALVLSPLVPMGPAKPLQQQVDGGNVRHKQVKVDVQGLLQNLSAHNNAHAGAPSVPNTRGRTKLAAQHLLRTHSVKVDKPRVVQRHSVFAKYLGKGALRLLSTPHGVADHASASAVAQPIPQQLDQGVHGVVNQLQRDGHASAGCLRTHAQGFGAVRIGDLGIPNVRNTCLRRRRRS